MSNDDKIEYLRNEIKKLWTMFEILKHMGQIPVELYNATYDMQKTLEDFYKGDHI